MKSYFAKWLIALIALVCIGLGAFILWPKPTCFEDTKSLSELALPDDAEVISCSFARSGLVDHGVLQAHIRLTADEIRALEPEAAAKGYRKLEALRVTGNNLLDPFVGRQGWYLYVWLDDGTIRSIVLDKTNGRLYLYYMG